MKHFGTFGLDTSNQCLWHDGAQIAIPPKPFAVLCYLVDNPGRLITHNELLDKLWPETYVQPQVLRTYMLELRKVLGDDAGQPKFIQTLPKRGYSFVARIHEQPIESEPERAASPVSAANKQAIVGILGRSDEMSRLAGLVELLAKGQRQIVFVTGETGIGKTALIDALCSNGYCLGTSEPVTTARGQCVEGVGAKENYYPVMEALSQLCASPEGDRACRILARMAPAWLAALGRQGDASAKPIALERMPGDLCAALEELAANHPMILILEDLHWADDATLHLLSALARRRANARLMILATCQPNAGSSEIALKTLKQDLVLRRLSSEIVVGPMDKASIRALICRELKQEQLPSGLASFVHQHSEGNPMFAIALIEHLIAQEYLVQVTVDGPTQWKLQAPIETMEASVPDGLAKMIELEIERLTPDEQRLLEAASLTQVAFPAWAVAAALESDLTEIEESCDALARRLHFVERVGEDELPDGTRSAFYAFAHGLYRAVLYQRQSAARRARRHLRIAERLRQLFSGREVIVVREVVVHLEAAGEWLRASSALHEAAKHAVSRNASAHAAELIDHALRTLSNLNEAESTGVVHQVRSEIETLRDSLSHDIHRTLNVAQKV